MPTFAENSSGDDSLDRVIRDINRKIKGEPELAARFAPLHDLAVKVRHQDHRQRGAGGLFTACARSRVHRQGQGAGAL
jgi:hypothetical protein